MVFAMERTPVGAGRNRSGNLPESGRRIAVMVMVLSGHIGLLILLLRPATPNRDATPAAGNNSPVLNLRFIRQPLPASLRMALPASRMVVSTPRAHGAATRRPPEPPPVQRATHIPAPSSETRSTDAPATPGSHVGNEASISDGGFQERLRNARHSYTVRGVPGSDTPYVSGIHLVDPMNQGVGAVMRKMQRLLGVANRHCIDVEVWRQLTPQELIARHISSDDVDKTNEKYGCNRPPGLSF